MGSSEDERCKSRDPRGIRGVRDMGLRLLWGTAEMGMDCAAAGMGSCIPLSMCGCRSVVLDARAVSPCQQLACSHGQALPVQLLLELPALVARTDPASSTCLVQEPILATSECCRVQIPQITGEGAAGSVQGVWAGEEQAALAHRGSGQAAWLLALRLCHAVPAVPEPTCLPRHTAKGHRGLCTLQESCGYTEILRPWLPPASPCIPGLELPVPSLPGPGKGTSCTDPAFRITVVCKEGYPG